MRNIIFLSVIFQLTQSISFAQNTKIKVEDKLSQADSVLIVSHSKLTVFYDTITKKQIHELVKNGRINENIIDRKYKLNKKEIDSLKPLFDILSKDFAPREEKGNFDFRYAILIFHKDNISFIDLGFEYQTFHSSKDLDIRHNIIHYDSWMILERFFKNRNIYILK